MAHKRMLIGMLLLILVLVAAQCAPAKKFECTDKLGCVDIGPNDPIHIAFAMVISGADATLGLDTKYGAEIAIDDKGGKLLGHSIKFDGQDSGCNAEGGTAAATKLAADKTIIAVNGTNCSSEAVPGVPILSEAGFTTVSPSNTAPYLTDPALRSPGYFRTAHNDNVQGAVAAQFVYNQLKITKAAAIHDGGPYTEALARVFAENFKQLGGTITAFEAVGPDDTDMKPALTRIAAGKPDLIYFPIFVKAGGFVCAQMRDVAGLEKTVMMGADGIYTPDFVKACGKNAIGMYWSSPDFSAFGAGYQTLVDKYKTKYNLPGTYAPFHAHSYDAMNIIFAAIEKVAVKDPDGTLHIGRQALRDAVAATKDFKGLTGNLTCDPNGDCADPRIATYLLADEAAYDAAVGGTMPKTPFWKQTK
ncbi:MAG: branched-chain amino acid ABC transporter substrate-binding protein [Anaerolineae bacterium]